MTYVLILGHGQHGKDTVAEMLRDKLKLDFFSSSEFVGREILWDQWGRHRYPNFKAMFDDRTNHRATWADMITEYNTPDATKTAATMKKRGYNMYVGMRKKRELQACAEVGLFTHVIWVHDPRKPEENRDVFDITTDCVQEVGLLSKMYYLLNDGTLEDLSEQLDWAIKVLGL